MTDDLTPGRRTPDAPSVPDASPEPEHRSASTSRSPSSPDTAPAAEGEADDALAHSVELAYLLVRMLLDELDGTPAATGDPSPVHDPRIVAHFRSLRAQGAGRAEVEAALDRARSGARALTEDLAEALAGVWLLARE